MPTRTVPAATRFLQVGTRTVPSLVWLAKAAVTWGGAPLGVHGLVGGVYALRVRNVDGSFARTGGVVLDQHDPLTVGAFALGDGTYALGVKHA